MGNSLKRSYQSSGLDDKDFESIDPAVVLPSSKRVKYGLDNITQLNSPYSVLAATHSITTLCKKYPLSANRRIAQVLNPTQISTTPVSKRAEVVRVSTGRLPKERSSHLFIRRKATGINPPRFSNVSTQGVSQPSLVDAPLSDAPNIHEDTKDEEMGNMLVHSATTWDISDDKTGINAKANQGKENVLSTDGICAVDPMSTAASTGRKKRMTDRTRTPLGNVDAAEYFAEGCDAESCFLIPAEVGEEQPMKNADHWINSENDGAEEERVAE
ncbi:hypothetical protein MMC29_006091 [Sticta canariensis]|nr:hypothetical protein [Sticta canariensis]